jgi:hypothetical protein
MLDPYERVHGQAGIIRTAGAIHRREQERNATAQADVKLAVNS